ncbi:hypothetical protein V1478_018871 [Vespula squamosa]|uniref:Uncharacterized protein n=1 Tax=Vespula squamosa TaxID=30214 RepID=A0ABD1ZWD0_VESSQ
MGKLEKDIALLNRNNKKKIADYKKQEIKPKRKKRKKDLEKLHRNALEASKDSLIGIYRNGAKGKEVRKGKLPSSKFYKARVQGEVAKFLDQDASERSEDVLELSPNTVRVNCTKKEKLFERIVSSDEEIQCQNRISKSQLTGSRKFSWSAMYRYEEFCAIICSENFDDQDTMILPDLPDPILKVKENLKHMHTDAMRQHFSRPDVNINDYFNDLKNENTFKSSIDENDSKNVSNIQSESYISSDHSESLTADVVEDSHFEISPKFNGEVEDKIQSNNILFSVPKKPSKEVKKTNVDRLSNFHLPSELFDRPISTITSSTDDENKKEINCQRCAKRNLNNVKRNMKFGGDDEFLVKNNQKYIYEHTENAHTKDAPEDREDDNLMFINKSNKANIPGDHCIETQKFIEDFVKDRTRRHRIRESNNIHQEDICTNLNDRAMAWKATKNLKHVPAILRRSVCDPTNITDLTHLLNGKRNGAYFKEPSKRNLDFNLNICSSLSSDDNSIIKTQFVKTNKCLENRCCTMPLKKQSSTRQTVDFCIPVEMNIKKNKNKVNLNKEVKKSTQLRKSHKSVTFSEGILLNGDGSMQSHYSQNHDTTQPTSIHQTTDTNHSKHCQILRQEIQNDNQSLLLKSTKPDRIYQPEVTFINPPQCDKYTTTQNYQDNESKPIYFQIINQSMKPCTEQKIFNQGLISKPNNLTAYEQTLSSQSMIQQPAVPVTSQNVQFMFRENDPHVYAFSELQNLKLLTLNESQNMYVSALNSVHEQKRGNECAIIPNVDQPTKYLAIEKDLNTQRIPIYFHNNDKSISQQYMPCKVITAVEKQNNDKVFFHEPTSQVILLQGNHLNDRNRQFVD